MKNIIFFLIFNFVNNSFNSGEVIYKIILPEAKEIDESKYPKHIIDQVKKINEERSRFEFILTFNKNISKYIGESVIWSHLNPSTLFDQSRSSICKS